MKHHVDQLKEAYSLDARLAKAAVRGMYSKHSCLFPLFSAALMYLLRHLQRLRQESALTVCVLEKYSIKPITNEWEQQNRPDRRPLGAWQPASTVPCMRGEATKNSWE